MIQRPSNRIYKSVVIVWLGLSVASVLLAAFNWKRLHQRLKTSAEAVAIVDAADGILKALLDVETAQRGYTISGNQSFLEPGEVAEAELSEQFDHLAELARNNPNEVKRIMDLRANAQVLLSHYAHLVKVRREQGFAAAAEIVKTGEGNKLMNELRRDVAAIKSQHYALISGQGRPDGGQLMRASLTSLIAGTIGIGAGLFAMYLARISLRHQQREREFLEAKLRAERESQEKSAFLANMSHEVRTPMNAILGFSELLSAELTEPKQRQYVQSIRSSATALLQLINDILDMSKVEAGALELRPEPADPREVCDFVAVFNEIAAKKGLRIECEIAENLPRALLLDRVRLRQILVNLVGNAVKFTDRGQISVTVTWEKQTSSSRITLIIEVQDTGVGVPQDKLDAIFKPFVQAGRDLEKEKSGTGLGLAIVKRLTELMGGTVTVASVLGQGSAFHLRFPNIPISARLPLADRADADGAVDFNELQPAKILVVDDNEQNCQLIAGMFAGSEHQLEFGTDGREAVEKSCRFRPDVVLMDYRMPNLDGVKALEEIRKQQGLELLPVIAVTASTLLSQEGNLRERFSGYLRKPFARRELFQELAQFLPRREKSDANHAPAAILENGHNSPTHSRNDWNGLTTQLRCLAASEWPEVRDTLAVNETRSFAQKLVRLGRAANCQPLCAYGESLVDCAETYAVDSCEKQLQEFPSLIERIERSQK